MASIKKNFGYNLILTLCNYIFPLITYPYVSRVLGVVNIGVCDFVDGIINYFVLFSILGVGSYGVREIAKTNNDKEKRNIVFSNLIFLNLIGTIVTVSVLIVLTISLESLSDYKTFLWLGVIKLVFNMFLIEWFFQGLQDFKFITIRSVAIKSIYVVLIFLFVQTPDDSIIYFGLTVVSTIINAIINWQYSKKFRSFDYRHLHTSKFIVPVMVFGYYRILTSMYTTLNVVFLGFVAGPKEVGFFSTATKLYGIVMGVFTAFTTVMVPKVSELLAEGENNKLQEIANRTFSLLLSLSIPLIIFCFFCSEDIVLIISGPGYEGAYLPFRIVIFLLIIIGMEQIVIQQFLMASNSNNSIFIVSSVGAIVGILFNLCITPRFGAVGSSISWGIAELSVLFSGVFLLKKGMGISLDFNLFIKKTFFAIIYILPLLFVCYLRLNTWTNVIISGIITSLLFLILNFKIQKNQDIIMVCKKIFNIGYGCFNYIGKL